MRKSKLRFWGFLAPSLIAFCIVVIIPTCIGFFYSLTNWNGIVGSDIKFVGFQNFIDIFTRDDSFVHAFLFTALFSVCAVVLVNLVGFAFKNISVLWTICKTLGFGFCRIGYVHGSYYYLLFV